jgi:acetyl-CoA carboxylase carboxyl transferase subunit beta
MLKNRFCRSYCERKDLTDKIGNLLSILLKQNSAVSSELNETTEDSQSLTKAAS